MVLKIRSLVIVSLLMMLLSGVVNGYDNPISSITDRLASKNYVPDSLNKETPNLFIGGIAQTNSNADYDDQKWKTFADQNGAIFVPTYYKGTPFNPIQDGCAVNDAAKSTKTDPHKTAENGLIRDELNGKTYGTIIGYSGGTTTVVTAMAEQDVKADTLILISPMMGWSPLEKFDWKGEFEKKIQKILDNGTKIIVIQSPDDTPSLGTEYQYKFPVNSLPQSSRFSKIEVHNVELEKSGNAGHKDFFDSYATENIKNGVYVDPNNQCTAKPNQLSGTQFPDWMNSKSKAASGLEAWGKHPKGWGVSQEYVNSHPEIYGYPSPTPSSLRPGPNPGSSGTGEGLTPEQIQAIQEWFDSGAGQPYDPPAEETNPVYSELGAS